MAHLQYLPGDPRLVDQLVYELKSKGIFDQFRKDCIADVDTRPAYQNLRQRVESSVATFLSRQCWKPDLNKNQLREKLRKHILDGNYLEQGVERIVDQVVNPKVASVFIPQVEDLVYNYLGIARKKVNPETSNGKVEDNDLLPTDLEAVSPGSVKSDDNVPEPMDEGTTEESTDNLEEKTEKLEIKEDSATPSEKEVKEKTIEDTEIPGVSELTNGSDVTIDKSAIPLPQVPKLENIPPPENSPPKIDLGKIELPKEPKMLMNVPINLMEIPLPEEGPKLENNFFKPISMNSDDESSSDSSLRRNMSPLTPIRNFINENSCDAQQGFENDSDSKGEEKKEPSTFRFTIEAKSPENHTDKSEKKEIEKTNLSYQFNNQVNINALNTPLYEDSSNSIHLQIDYESDVNSKVAENKLQITAENSEDSKKDKKPDEKKSSHKSSHRSRDSHRHSSSKDKRSDSKHSNSRDSSRHDKKSSKEDKPKSSKEMERPKDKDKTDKKDDKEVSKHRSSHKSSSSKDKDSKSQKSSSSSRHSTKTDDKKDRSHRDKNEKSSDRSKDRSKDSKSHKSDKDRKGSSSSSSSKNDKEKKKDKKENDDHYSVSGRGNHSRRSTDRDSNDGSSSSKGSHNQSHSRTAEAKKENKSSSTKSENTSTSNESPSPSDKDQVLTESESKTHQSRVVRVETLEIPISAPPRLPFVPDVTMKKPRFAANLQEAKRLMKLRRFLDEEQKRMNQEAALLLEFQANVRPSLSQVYSSIPGPELEFACVSTSVPLEQHVTFEAQHALNNNIEENHTQNNIECNTTDAAENAVENLTENEVLMESAEIPENSEANIELNENTVTSDNSNDKDETVITKEVAATAFEDTANNNNDVCTTDPKLVNTETYNENKPFAQLVHEISEYSKASEKLRNGNVVKNDAEDVLKPTEEDNKNVTGMFEITVITEELSENEEFNEKNDTNTEITLPDDIKDLKEKPLEYFAEHEKFDAEILRHQFETFMKIFTENVNVTDKLYLINCDTYEENILKEVSKAFGEFEIVNYYRNGCLKLPKLNKNLVKDVNVAEEITLPIDKEAEKSQIFSPVKSECSFELSSDYDAKLEEMVNKTSRQQIMEIILGSVLENEEVEMPKIDYCLDVAMEEENGLKRKIETENTQNNNNSECVLTPSKVRRLSESDQISSTTNETEEMSKNNKTQTTPRSKFLGRARRVGLSKPRKPILLNSPSSDKSVENYEQNSRPLGPETPNGKLKAPPRKVQRYDTSDLYKPKTHYLSRRNNIT